MTRVMILVAVSRILYTTIASPTSVKVAGSNPSLKSLWYECTLAEVTLITLAEEYDPTVCPQPVAASASRAVPLP